MPFLKNFNFAFNFNDFDYNGELILNPRIQSKSLVNIEKFNSNSSKFGIHNLQDIDIINLISNLAPDNVIISALKHYPNSKESLIKLAEEYKVKSQLMNYLNKI